MEKDRVPQDDENLLEGKFKVIKYALDENGNYVTVPSVGWEPENIALKQAWEVIEEKMEAARVEIRAGRLSPIAFWMEKNQMDESLLSDYMELPKRIIRKHLEPVGFASLDTQTKKRYADVFRISPEQLDQIEDNL